MSCWIAAAFFFAEASVKRTIIKLVNEPNTSVMTAVRRPNMNPGSSFRISSHSLFVFFAERLLIYLFGLRLISDILRKYRGRFGARENELNHHINLLQVLGDSQVRGSERLQRDLIGLERRSEVLDRDLLFSANGRVGSVHD